MKRKIVLEVIAPKEVISARVAALLQIAIPALEDVRVVSSKLVKDDQGDVAQ